jgi:hypothetical protein
MLRQKSSTISPSAGVAKESVEKYDQEYNKWNLIVDSLRISSHFSRITATSASPTSGEIFFTEDKYLKTTQEILTKLGSRPGVILLVRPSDDLQECGCYFDIRLVAPLPVRIARVAEMLKVSEKEAAKKIVELTSQERVICGTTAQRMSTTPFTT